MQHTNSNRTDATQQQLDNANLDAYLIDEEFDDFIDCELLAIRETFADCGNF